jgi:hypothetical protein
MKLGAPTLGTYKLTIIISSWCGPIEKLSFYEKKTQAINISNTYKVKKVNISSCSQGKIS